MTATYTRYRFARLRWLGRLSRRMAEIRASALSSTRNFVLVNLPFAYRVLNGSVEIVRE